MKTLLALIIAYSATMVLYDRTYQMAVIQQSPELAMCNFKPVINYGEIVTLKGYFESGKCCKYKDRKCQKNLY